MLYVAVPLARGDTLAVVRAATPLGEIEPVVNQLRVLLGLAGLLGLAIAVFMSGLASHFLSRTLRSLVERASAMAGGSTPAADCRRDCTDEIGGLAGSLNRMAEDLEQAVTTLATERDRFRGGARRACRRDPGAGRRAAHHPRQSRRAHACWT